MDSNHIENKNQIQKEIGERIKEMREGKKLSQQQLAELTGYTSRSSIAKIENGAVDLSQSKVMAFAKALSCKASYLMGWDDARCFHLNLDYLMQYKEINIGPLSVALGISEDKINLFLNDKLDPTKEELFKIATFFKTEPEDLLTTRMNSFTYYSDYYGNDSSEMFDDVELTFGYGVRQIVDLAISLNVDGLNKVVEYMRDLTDSNKYLK